MSLIMDIFKRTQQVRSREAETTSLLGDLPSNEQRGKSFKKQWGLISASVVSLCILLFIFLRTCISPSIFQPDRAIVFEEGKPSVAIAKKKSLKPPKEEVGLQKDENLQTSAESLNPATGGTGSGRADLEKPFNGGAPLTSRPHISQEEKGSRVGKRSVSEKKRASLIKQMAKEEIPHKPIEVEQESGKDHVVAPPVFDRLNVDFPIGALISQGNAKMEVKDKIWRTVESSYAPILEGKKIKIEKGTARISLSNHSLIEVTQNTVLSFEHEGQLNLLEGGIHFRIPSAAQMNFKIGALSVTTPHPLNPQAGVTTALIKEEETRGSLFLLPEGTLGVRSVQGSLSILDHENRVLTTTSSGEQITVPRKILSGQEPWRVEQHTRVPAPETEEKVQAPIGKVKNEVDELERYLVEFSIHLKGKDLPADLDTQTFFSLLEGVYPHQDIIEKVKQYPVKVRRKGKSYVLILCDKEFVWVLYEDLGETTNRVDNIYWPEGLTVPCPKPLPPYGLLAIPAAAIATGVWLGNRDDKDDPPLCP